MDKGRKKRKKKEGGNTNPILFLFLMCMSLQNGEFGTGTEMSLQNGENGTIMGKCRLRTEKLVR